MLRSALGPAIGALLVDPQVTEVMLNADGKVWVDRLIDGMADAGERLAPAQAERIIRLVAHHIGAEVDAGSPCVLAQLPESGERFEGLLPRSPPRRCSQSGEWRACSWRCRTMSRQA